MPAPLVLEQLKDQTAQQLRLYRIMPAGQGFALWKWLDGWYLVRPYPSREAAEDYLFNKLPPIQGGIH